MNEIKTLPIDTILMLVLGTVYVAAVNESLGSLLMLPVGSYIILDTLSRSNTLRVSPGKLFDTKFAFVMLTVFLVVVLPTVSRMAMRQGTAPWQHIENGGLQIEESIKYLLQGRNPYTEDYLGTPLEEWVHLMDYMRENPALHHNAYLPFIFLFSTPFYLVLKHVTGWYDQRLVYLILFMCTLWPLMKHATKLTRKLSLSIVFGLNVFDVRYTIGGGNDSFVWFWLIMSTCLLQKDRITLSALSLGLARASKQTACLFDPFFLAYLWIKAPCPGRWASLRKAYPLFFVPLLLILPFLLWDAAAFTDDTLLYLSGHAALSYPIGGLGFSSLLLNLGLIRDKTAYYPFMVLQAALCLPLLVFLPRRQLSDNTVKRCWLGYGLLLLTFIFFSRFFNYNYMAMAVNALTLGYSSTHGSPGV